MRDGLPRNNRRHGEDRIMLISRNGLTTFAVIYPLTKERCGPITSRTDEQPALMAEASRAALLVLGKAAGGVCETPPTAGERRWCWPL
jgi:hypothetical protein